MQSFRPQSREIETICLFLLPIVVVVMIGVGAGFHRYRALSSFLLRENGPFEIVGFLACIGASILFAVLTVGSARRRRLLAAFWLGFLSAGFLFIGMEEISWGQSFLGWDTPQAFANNVQGETNLHNLQLVHLRSHVVGITALAVYFVIVPTAYFGIARVKAAADRVWLPIVPLPVAMLFAAGHVFFYPAFATNYQQSRGIPINYGEMQEMIYQICALLFATNLFLRRKAPDAPTVIH